MTLARRGLVAVGLLAVAGAAAAADAEVAVRDFRFDPSSLSVEVGDTVRWTNVGDAPHTVTFNGGAASGTLANGQSWERAFPSAGTFQYVCGFHASMVGTVSVAAPAPPPPDDPPEVAILSPAEGATVPRGVVRVDGTASSDVVEVALLVDGVAQAATGTGTWSYDWDASALEPGSRHTLVARARDATSTADSRPINVTVRRPDLPPTVVVEAPAPNSTVRGLVTVRGSASDDRGVARIEVILDDADPDLATGTTAWAWTWDASSAAPGPHTIAVRAVDTAGAASATATLVLHVDVAVEPRVGFRAPASGARVNGVVNVSGTAQAVDGVDVRVDALPWRRIEPVDGEWSFALDTRALADGTHRVAARGGTRDGYATATPLVLIVDNARPPTVTRILPFDGSEATAPVRIFVDAEESAATVEVHIDGVFFGEGAVPFDRAWAAPPGSHAAEAEVCLGRTCLAKTWAFTVVTESAAPPVDATADPPPEAGRPAPTGLMGPLAAIAAAAATRRRS